VTSLIKLTPLDLVLAASLILINALISFRLRLGLERQLLIASLRTVVQLVLIGLLLDWIFSLSGWYWPVSLLLIMTTVAASAAASRSGYRFPGIYKASFAAMASASTVVTCFSILFIIELDPWYKPQYIIPLFGMLLGNTVNGISLGLRQWGLEVTQRWELIETRLACGATAREASEAALREAMRTGMIPIVNSMMIVGLVSLPGMMTGLILQGAAPGDAVAYQILIMFMIASGTALGTLAAVWFAFRASFGPSEELLRERFVERG